jgi:hypothetical protein
MKTAMAVLIAVGALACGSSDATAPSLTGEVRLADGGNGKIAVSGSGHLTAVGADTDWRTFSFHAKADEDGSNASGSFQSQSRQNDPDNYIKGDIVCVAVVGNQAWMVGVVTSSTAPTAPVGTFTRFRVIDNGEGSGSPPDQISLLNVGFLVPPPYCFNKPDAPALFDIEAGNVQIH